MKASARALRRGGSSLILQKFAHLAYSRRLGLSSFVSNGSVDSRAFACSLSARRGGNRVVPCLHRLAARMDSSEKRHPVVFPGFVAAQNQDGLSQSLFPSLGLRYRICPYSAVFDRAIETRPRVEEPLNPISATASATRMLTG